jgi:hypothetical protein
LPIGPGKLWLSNLHGAAARIAGGWQIQGVTVFQTGQRFTAAFSGVDTSNTNNPGGRPDRIGNGNLPTNQRTLNHWFDASAFAPPPANSGRFGNAGIGILEGPGTKNFSLSLYKNIRLRERARLQFSLNSTNTFNHPNFRPPANNISVPNTVGVIGATQGVDASGSRVVILGGRVTF